MEAHDSHWRRTRAHADGYLRRHGDPWTRAHREDLVQEATFAAWRWSRGPHDAARFPAAVRTITRRIRSRALFARSRERRTEQMAVSGVSLASSSERPETMFVVAGRRFPEHIVRPWLDEALAELLELDRCLLLAFYEGICCAELATRFRRSVPCVKTRIHRARRRVQRSIEACARVASCPDRRPTAVTRKERRVR